MRISDRNTILVKALRAAFGDAEFRTRDITSRIAGLARREPVNAVLHSALEGCLGREMSASRIGSRLVKLNGQRFGDLEVRTTTPERTGPRWRYYVHDYSVRVEREPKLDIRVSARLSPEIKAAIKADDAAMRERREALKSEVGPALDIPAPHVKPGPGGAPVPDDDYRSYTAPAKPAATPAEPARDPQRPPPGKKMNQWTASELAAEKAYQRANMQVHDFNQRGNGFRSIQPQVGFDPFRCLAHDE